MEIGPLDSSDHLSQDSKSIGKTFIFFLNHSTVLIANNLVNDLKFRQTESVEKLFQHELHRLVCIPDVVYKLWLKPLLLFFTY